MEAVSELELKELLIMDERLYMLLGAVRSYKDNVKGLKLCSKLIALEQKALKNSKAPVPAGDLNAIVWRYDDFASIAKRLTRTSDASAYGKAAAELDSMIELTGKEIAEIEAAIEALNAEEEKSFGETVKEGAKNFAGKVAQGAQKVGGFVSDKVDKLKKALAGDDDSE